MDMFHNPHAQPIGAHRQMMGKEEYMRYAANSIADDRTRGQAMQQLFDEAYLGPKGMYSNQVRSLMERQPQRTLSDPGHPAGAPEQKSQLQLNDDMASRLVDGRGDGGADYTKGMLPMVQKQQATALSQRPQPNEPKRHVPSSAILNADPHYKWTIDRDQQSVNYSDPAVLWDAVHLGAENGVVARDNKHRMVSSTLAFGQHELNAGGHRLNENAARADDYGIGRLRSDYMDRPRLEPPSKVNLLIAQDPRAANPDRVPHNPYAGKSSCSANISFGMDGAPDPPRANPHAGRRAQSNVFGAQSGPSGPTPPTGPGNYLGLDHNGVLIPKHSDYAGVRGQAEQMEPQLFHDVGAANAASAARHQQRRGQLSAAARRVPAVEQVVFNSPLAPQDVQSQPPATREHIEGKRSVHSGLMPEEALRAARTTVGRRELGGDADAAYPDPPSNRLPPTLSGYADHDELLHYTEYKDKVHHSNEARPSPQLDQVGQTMMQGTVDPHAHSDEPRGLPKRHPGAERLRRGGGVDGLGRDHQGRQLATSLVDEVIFGRSNMQGKVALTDNRANFGVNQAGDFAHR